jgi:hypothetical protein
MKKSCLALALLGCAASVFAQGTGITPKQSEVMKQLLASYEAKAREGETDKSKAGRFEPFSADAGRDFYVKRRTWKSTDPTCSSCHTDNPANAGKHAKTKKPIKPLAPSVNPQRFTDVAKVEQNFSEHCVDLMGRNCEPGEKGNFLTYLMTVK